MIQRLLASLVCLVWLCSTAVANNNTPEENLSAPPATNSTEEKKTTPNVEPQTEPEPELEIENTEQTPEPEITPESDSQWEANDDDEMSNFANYSYKGEKNAYFSHEKLKWSKGHWTGFGLHYSGLVQSLTHLTVPDEADYLATTGRSIGVSINPFDVFIVRNHRLGLFTGIGFELNNFRFSNNVGLKYEDGKIKPDYQYEEQGADLKKSKLFTSYVNVPLLFEVLIGPKHDFFVNAGVVTGVRLGSHTKVQSRSPIVTDKVKERGNLGLRNFHFGYMLHAGFRHVGLSASYYSTPIFRDNAGPKVRQVNIGISVLY